MSKYKLIINQVEAVIKSLNPNSKSVIEEKDSKTYCFEYNLDNTTIEVFINIFEEFECYRLAIHLPFIVPENKRIEIAQYIFDQNEYLSYGTFLFSFDTGRIVLKSDVHFQNFDQLDISDYFPENLNDCFDLLNNIYPAFMQLIFSNISPIFLNRRFIAKQKVFYN